jgi:formylmethanofuran dehydrogenase subunit D
MKKGEIALVVALVLFGVVYQAVEKGKARFSGDFSFFSAERKPKGSRFAEFPEAEKLFAASDLVTIDNPAGEVIVNRSGDGQVHLLARLRVYYSNKDDVEKIRRAARVRADRNDRELKISIQHPSPFPYRRLRIFLHLLIPENTKLAVANREGDVIIRGAGKEIRLNQENGNLLLENIGSNVELRLKNCQAEMKNIAAHADITASHSRVALENAASLRLAGRHGDCVLKNIEKDAAIECAFGKLTLDGAAAVEITARHCAVRATNIRNGAVVASKHGKVFIENVKGDLRVSSRSGRIDLRQALGENTVVENSYADTSIRDFHGGSLDVRIKNGNLDLEAKNVAERVNIESRYAELNLGFGILSDPTFHVRTAHGRIVADTPLELERYEKDDECFANRSGGKPEILVNNIYGDIHLKSAI